MKPQLVEETPSAVRQEWTAVPESNVKPAPRRHRGFVMRRALLAADLVGIGVAFAFAAAVFGPANSDTIVPSYENVIFVATLPVWLLLFKLHGLYDRDEDRADHSTADDLFTVIQAVTLGVWLFEILSLATGLASPMLARLALFWLLAIVLVAVGRVVARVVCRRLPSYTQRVIVVGGGDIGQLIARKIEQHPEYGLDLLGMVDADPKGKRQDIANLETLGGLERLPAIVSQLDVDRVIVAFSREPDAETMEVIRSLRDEGVAIDVVPRLFELVGPRASVQSLEGLSVVCLPPARLSRSSLLIKRALDIVVASVTLVIVSPLFAVVAYRIKRDSPGPVFFRQTRLGMGKKPFKALKFRTMKVDTDEDEHRAYVRSINDMSATIGTNGVYKLDRSSAVTPFGQWLRKTSIDELPQLINVLRGQMSIVGPRPCIPYELENFEAHHEDRFLVPQGITGLWQVTARANSTFGEALDMDVAYVQGWSLGLDLKLMFRTPFALLRQRGSTT